VRPARGELVKEGLSAEVVAKRLLMPKSGLARLNGRHKGYEVSIGKRKQIEKYFGWMKGIGLMRKL